MHRTLNFMCQLIIVSSAFSTLLIPVHANELTDDDDINLSSDIVKTTPTTEDIPQSVEDNSQAPIEPQEAVRGDLELLGSN